MDEALLEKQQEAYAVAGADVTQSIEPLAKKRKQQRQEDKEVGDNRMLSDGDVDASSMVH